MRCKFCQKLLLRTLVGGSDICDECRKAEQRRQLELEMDCYEARRARVGTAVHPLLLRFRRNGTRR